MTIPSFLKTGDHVAIIAPSGFVLYEQIANAIEVLTSWGLKIQSGKNLYSKHFSFAGSDEQRKSDFQEAIDNPKIKAIFCARGGYGALRIIDKINWTKFIESPKWIIGYSDITVLHSCLNNVLEVASIHGPMPMNFEKLKNEQNSLLYLKQLLWGEKITYKMPNLYKIKPSVIEGVLKGGNLSLLYSLRGTDYDFKTKNSILFIEEIGEYMYHIDRMLQNFKLGNKFNGLKGIVLGDFTEIKENDNAFAFSLKEILIEVTKGEIPIIYNFPAGHTVPNYPIILGQKAKIIIDNNDILFEPS